METSSRRAALIKRLGLGTAPLGNLYQPLSESQARATVDASWEVGIRHFDTAPFYGFGLSERRLGDALRERNRDSYFISTKAGRRLRPVARASPRFGFVSPLPFEPVFDYSYEGVMRSFEDSLQRLGLPRIDCLYLHDLGRLTHGEAHESRLQEARGGLAALRALRDQGLVRQIGLGVNEVEICRLILADFDLDRILLAGRYTLLNHGPLDGFFDECAKRGVRITVGGVFNSGILAAGTGSRRPLYYDYAEAPAEVIERVRRIEAVCARFEVKLAAAAVQLPLAHPAVDNILLGMASTKQVKSNASLLDLPISEAFWRALVNEKLLPEGAPLPQARVEES